jgi:hypothetical protein
VAMGGNLLINGDYLSTAGGILALLANGSNWEEVTRTQTVLQPYNAVPNGDFRGWTRPFTTGSQFTSTIDGQYTADRWVTNKAGTAVWDVVRDTSLPAVAYNMPGSLYSYKVNVTTADASIAANELYAFYTAIEGYDFQPLANGFAASWWAKAHRTGTYCLGFFNKAFNRSYIVEYVITVADTWQYFTAVVPAPTGVWPYDTQVSMYCAFNLAAGSNWTGASANSWMTSGAYVTANQINGVAATSDTFSVWGLNIVPGTVPQPLQPMPIPLQMERLRRYCQRLAPGVAGRYGLSLNDSTTTTVVHIPLPTPMVGVPAATFSAASGFWIYSVGGTFTITGMVTSTPGPGLYVLQTSGSAGLTNGFAGMLMDANVGTSSILLEANPV